MSIWNDLGLNGKREKEYGHAYLKVNSASGIIEKKFRYKNIASSVIMESSSIMPIESEVNTKTIRTSFYWLPFCKGAIVRFEDGQELRISAINKLYDDDKLLNHGIGVVGLEISF